MSPTTPPQLTLDRIDTRVLSVPLRRPIVGKVGEYHHWPFILVDVITREGIVGHGYLEPYRASATKSILALIDDMAAMQRGRPIAPFDRFADAMRALHFNGRQQGRVGFSPPTQAGYRSPVSTNPAPSLAQSAG